MDQLIRQLTKTTPYVHLDSNSNTFLIAGRSIPIDAEVFYKPIINWIASLEQQKIREINFKFRFDFFNIASSKRIMIILNKLDKLQEDGFRVRVLWSYENGDEDMHEIGRDYEQMMTGLRFTFEEYDSRTANLRHLQKIG